MRKLFLLCGVLALSACASVDVKPWEKGDLAKSIMALEPDAHDQKIVQHIRVSKENANGGYGVGGGGCGCN